MVITHHFVFVFFTGESIAVTYEPLFNQMTNLTIITNDYPLRYLMYKLKIIF